MVDDVGKPDPLTEDPIGDDAPLLEDAPLAEIILDVGRPLGARVAFTPDGGAVEAYVAKQLAPRSKENALAALRRVSRLLAGRQIDPAQIPWPRITFALATRIRTRLYELTREGTITPGTANLTLSHIRGLIRMMYSEELIDDKQLNIIEAKGLKNVPGTRVSRGRAISEREERALRKAARDLDGYRGVMFDAAIVLAMGAGLRREEIAALTLERVGVDELRILGKGNKERRVPIDEQMRYAIDEWLKERVGLAPTHDGFFCSPRQSEKELSPWGFWSLVRAAAHTAFGGEQCGDECPCLEIVSGPHDFRRTFATRLLERGMDIRDLQVLMGHENIETTTRYDKRGTEELFKKRRAIRIIS